ncbi:MAG: energy transducer TonB [Bacteroidota bacterium]
MKNKLFTLLLILVFGTAYSQDSNYEYNGRLTPTIKKEMLREYDYITDIMPDFSRYFALRYDESELFNEQMKWASYPFNSMNAPQKNYTRIIDFVSIELCAKCQGKTVSAESTTERLSMEQKNLLNTADLGSDISIKIKFKYKFLSKVSLKGGNAVREGKYGITIVPDTEAEYPGGTTQFSAYLRENIINKIPSGAARDRILDAFVKFTINEDGQITGLSITKSSSDKNADQLLIIALNGMPKWKPALNSKGQKVKQEFNVAFSGRQGC